MSWDYHKELEPQEIARYEKKLTVLGTACPYTFPADMWVNNPREWPFVVYEEVHDYLITRPGIATRMSREDYKSLRSENLATSKWVRNVLHCELRSTGFYLLKAEVTPSYKVNNKTHRPWVAINASDGYIIAGHCTCAAGNGETCTHIGGLLYRIEMCCRLGLTKPQTCTDVACLWNNVAWSGVKPNTLARIQFYKESTKSARPPVKKKRIERPDVPPSEELKEQFLTTLLNQNELVVVLSTFSSTACNFIDKRPLPVVPRFPRPVPELVQYGLPLQLTLDEIELVQVMTHKQSACVPWYEQRVGRITSSVVYDVLHTSTVSPSECLVLRICTINTNPIRAESLKWGREHEKDAIAVYTKAAASIHKNFIYKKAGLHIDIDNTVLAASPDGLVSCDCCGVGCLEVKAPYSLRDMEKGEWHTAKAYPLDVEGNVRVGHSHELQCQHHMHVTGHTFCHYVMWTPKGSHITRVDKRDDYVYNEVPRLSQFWQDHIEPELRTGAIAQKKAENAKKKTEKENNPKGHCKCGKADRDWDMVGCDSKTCPHEWFHFECVGLKTDPNADTWYCPACRKGKKKEKTVTKGKGMVKGKANLRL